MEKKINLFIVDKYICSSNRYKSCKDFVEKVKRDGCVEWQDVACKRMLVFGNNAKIQAFYDKEAK